MNALLCILENVERGAISADEAWREFAAVVQSDADQLRTVADQLWESTIGRHHAANRIRKIANEIAVSKAVDK